jgi:hypothetical protein
MHIPDPEPLLAASEERAFGFTATGFSPARRGRLGAGAGLFRFLPAFCQILSSFFPALGAGCRHFFGVK